MGNCSHQITYNTYRPILYFKDNIKYPITLYCDTCHMLRFDQEVIDDFSNEKLSWHIFITKYEKHRKTHESVCSKEKCMTTYNDGILYDLYSAFSAIEINKSKISQMDETKIYKNKVMKYTDVFN